MLVPDVCCYYCCAACCINDCCTNNCCCLAASLCWCPAAQLPSFLLLRLLPCQPPAAAQTAPFAALHQMVFAKTASAAAAQPRQLVQAAALRQCSSVLSKPAEHYRYQRCYLLTSCKCCVSSGALTALLCEEAVRVLARLALSPLKRQTCVQEACFSLHQLVFA